jgi:hypothetical protein
MRLRKSFLVQCICPVRRTFLITADQPEIVLGTVKMKDALRNSLARNKMERNPQKRYIFL